MPQQFAFTLCADDYGMTPAVSAGILEAAAAGRISCASAMANMADWPRAAAAWRAAAPRASLGLHFNLTLAAPLAPMPALAPGGGLPALPAIAAAALRSALPLAEIEAEAGRQIDAFRQAFGADPAHIDGHQHVHALPGVRRAFFAALRRAGLQGVLLRDSSDRPARIARRKALAAKAMQVNALTFGFRAAARKAGFALNDGFAGYSSFAAQAVGAELFGSYLIAPGPRHLVMCHPGHIDEALRRLDPVVDSRPAELAFLLSPQFLDLLTARGARLSPSG